MKKKESLNLELKVLHGQQKRKPFPFVPIVLIKLLFYSMYVFNQLTFAFERSYNNQFFRLFQYGMHIIIFLNEFAKLEISERRLYNQDSVALGKKRITRFARNIYFNSQRAKKVTMKLINS